MSITALAGPVVAFGQAPYLDYNPEIAPSLFWGGSGVLDPRLSYQYEPGQGFGSPTMGWIGYPKVNTLNVIPMTKSNTILAAAQHATAGTALTLASANADGLAVNVNGALYGSVTASSLVNGLCIDPLVASMTANVTINTNILTVTAVATGSSKCYNRLAIGMVLTDATTAANIPTGTFITGYLTGNGGLGTYTMSANATASATGDTVTGIFTGINGVGFGTGVVSPGTLNAIPYGSAGTIMAWLPEAMCSRAICIVSTTSQVDSNVFTIKGADVYGQAMTETITTSGTGATTTSGKKAWKYIQSVTPSLTDGTGNYSVGTLDIIGLPLRSDNFTAVVGTEWDLALYFNSAGIASSTGYLAGVLTTPTASTGDVRGTYAVQAATNGILRLIATQTPNAAAMGAGTIGVGLFGQTQFTTI